jgi:GNAT superfamily N-acetyltransferase
MIYVYAIALCLGLFLNSAICSIDRHKVADIFSEKDAVLEIVDYQQDEHFDDLYKLAQDNLDALISTGDFDSSEDALDEIMRSLDYPNTSTIVLLLNGKCIGFISYFIKLPIVQKFLFDYNILNETGLVRSGYINAFAVEKKYQNQGYGTLLLKHALNICKKKSVSRVELRTTPGDNNLALHKFYRGHKFTEGYRSKSTGVTSFSSHLAPEAMPRLTKVAPAIARGIIKLLKK